MKWVAISAGVGLGILLTVLKVLEASFYAKSFTIDTYLAIVAVLFLTIGLFFGRKAFMPKPLVKQPQPMDSNLSGRETEILKLLAEGYSNQEIAAQLNVSINTVKTHISNVYDKLNVNRRTQAVAKARELGLILI